MTTTTKQPYKCLKCGKMAELFAVCEKESVWNGEDWECALNGDSDSRYFLQCDCGHAEEVLCPSGYGDEIERYDENEKKKE